MGTPQFAVPTLERSVAAGHEVLAVFTQPDRPKGRGQKDAMPPVKVIWYEGRKDNKLVQPPDELTEKVVTEYNKLLAMRNDKRVLNGKKVSLTPGGWIAVGRPTDPSLPGACFRLAVPVP